MTRQEWVKAARFLSLLLLIPLGTLYASETTVTPDIDRETMNNWPARYRDWHYWPDHVIPTQPNIPGHDGGSWTWPPGSYSVVFPEYALVQNSKGLQKSRLR